MKKKDIFIVAAILAVAAVLLAVNAGRTASPGSRGKAIIYVGGVVYREVPLAEGEQVVRVEQDEGRYNEVVVGPRGVYVRCASCKNQDCVKQGEITLAHHNSGLWRNWIICLPNRVSVELVAEEG